MILFLLSLSLQAKGVVCPPPPPIGAFVRNQKQAEERREREQRELNDLIKQRKTVDESKNQKGSLPEAVALCVFASFLAFFPIFIERFFRDKETK